MTYNQLTTESFIQKAKEIHKGKYNYSKVNYVNGNTPIIIICPEHGEFEQLPKYHLKGQGCSKCTRPNYGMTTEAFIEKCKEIYGDKYSYEKTVYTKKQGNIIVTCPIHGDFTVRCDHFLNGFACRKCKNPLFCETKEEFLEKAQEVHGNRYDYSKVDYKGAGVKVCIICPEHGEFEQTPSRHLRGRGCRKCGGTALKTERDFIKDLERIFGNKYDYSKVNYINSKTPVTLICPKHGEFSSLPNNLLKGKGCGKCVGRYMTEDEFLEKAHKIHGDKYDYSKVNWETISNLQKDKITIICPEHGEFEQYPYSHLIGQGCPICNVGYTRSYKFNLLNEFVDEFRLRDFLMTNDENLIYIILRNIEKIDPKFNPIVKDIDRVLRSDSTNPIEDLESKYRTTDETITTDSIVEEVNSVNIDDIDLDDDDAVEAFISNTSTTVEKTEPTIEDLTRARENEINLINTIEHMLTPEDRQFIKDKFLNDKRRNWMLERDKIA